VFEEETRDISFAKKKGFEEISHKVLGRDSPR
jgi:hypothetical protein